MSPAHVLEPTYNRLRRSLLLGEWAPSHRLEAARLASDLGVSITPVRDSLNRLAGERLIDTAAGDGFRIPRLDETELRALLDWHRFLILLALGRRATPPGAITIPMGSDGIAERTALLFASIASIMANRELMSAVTTAGGRLGRYRRYEDLIFRDVADELDAIEGACASPSLTGLVPLVEAYHDRRLEAAAETIHRARQG